VICKQLDRQIHITVADVLEGGRERMLSRLQRVTAVCSMRAFFFSVALHDLEQLVHASLRKAPSQHKSAGTIFAEQSVSLGCQHFGCTVECSELRQSGHLLETF
jgi:hypothetical protein